MPIEAGFALPCPPPTIVATPVLVSGTLSVGERISAERNPPLAIAHLHACVSWHLASTSNAVALRELPAVALQGTGAESQLVMNFSDGMVEISTIVAIGSAVLTIEMTDQSGHVDNATVLRIVDAAVHRFQNPRPSGGPFASIVSRAPVPSTAP